MRKLTIYIAGVISFTLLMVCGLNAQTLKIWPGIAPGSENWKQKERVETAGPGNVVYNVVVPTLTAFLPKKSKATRTSVIVAPGGAFMLVSINHEGNQVAQWLQVRGIAAFVLKYRVVQTPPDFHIGAPGVGAAVPGMAGRGVVRGPSGGTPRMNVEDRASTALLMGFKRSKLFASTRPSGGSI